MPKKEKEERIKSYEYKKWDEFDVDAELKKIEEIKDEDDASKQGFDSSEKSLGLKFPTGPGKKNGSQVARILFLLLLTTSACPCLKNSLNLH